MTPAGIEPATFRFVAQHLNLCASATTYTTLLHNAEQDNCHTAYGSLVSSKKNGLQKSRPSRLGGRIKWRNSSEVHQIVGLADITVTICNVCGTYLKVNRREAFATCWRANRVSTAWWDDMWIFCETLGRVVFMGDLGSNSSWKSGADNFFTFFRRVSITHGQAAWEKFCSWRVKLPLFPLLS